MGIAPYFGQQKLMFCDNFPLFPILWLVEQAISLYTNYRLYAHFVVTGQNDCDDFPDTVIIGSSALYPLAKGARQADVTIIVIIYACVIYSA